MAAFPITTISDHSLVQWPVSLAGTRQHAQINSHTNTHMLLSSDVLVCDVCNQVAKTFQIGTSQKTVTLTFTTVTLLVTGHGKLRSYLHRFGITDNPMCPCEEEEQTADHLIFQCKRLTNQRNNMIKQIKDTGGDWPTTKETLVNNYLHIFVNFAKSIDFTD